MVDFLVLAISAVPADSGDEFAKTCSKSSSSVGLDSIVVLVDLTLPWASVFCSPFMAWLSPSVCVVELYSEHHLDVAGR